MVNTKYHSFKPLCGQQSFWTNCLLPVILFSLVHSTWIWLLVSASCFKGICSLWAHFSLKAPRAITKSCQVVSSPHLQEGHLNMLKQVSKCLSFPLSSFLSIFLYSSLFLFFLSLCLSFRYPSFSFFSFFLSLFLSITLPLLISLCPTKQNKAKEALSDGLLKSRWPCPEGSTEKSMGSLGWAPLRSVACLLIIPLYIETCNLFNHPCKSNLLYLFLKGWF